MKFLKLALINFVLGMMFFSYAGASEESSEKPNIIWLMAEDIGNDLECYGTPAVQTPNLNRLAEEGIRYNNCISTNPISSPNRSAMLTGVHQNVLGAQHHRSNRNTPLNNPYKPITYLLRKAGYTCILGHHGVMGKGRKIDVNFKSSRLGHYDGEDEFGIFDKLDTLKVSNQPFFAQIQLAVTHRGDWWNRIREESSDPVDPGEVELPPFMADHPVVRKDWARYLDQMEYMDDEVGMIMEELEEKGIADNTVVIFIGDNGRCNVRGKGYLFDSGLRVPLIVRWPGRLKPGQVSDQMVSVTDLSASILNIAGAKVPYYLTGIPFITEDSGRDAVFSARDLWDEVLEKSRSITTQRYKYIRHHMPWVPYDSHQAYLEFYRPAVHIMRQMDMKNKLTPAQAHFFKERKPKEELYDLKKDPYETNNLVDDPEYRDILNRLRVRLSKWEQQLPDTSPEDFNFVTPGAVELLDWVRYTKPELYKQMLNGKEIGFQRLNGKYRRYKDSVDRE